MHIRRCSVSCGSSLETERCRSGCRQIYSSLPFRRRVARQQIRCRDKVLDRRSGESDDELDTSITLEIKQRADPRYLSKVAKRLDVVWTVSSRKGRKPGQCACCGGTGLGPCSFCRGSGALTLGDHVFCSLHDGCKPCPVCKSKGAVKCEHCSGTGFRAAWMEDPICSVDSTGSLERPQ